MMNVAHNYKRHGQLTVNPLTAGLEYIRFYVFLLPHYLPYLYFKHVKDET